MPGTELMERLRARAQSLKRETYALYLAYRHPDTPWGAKILVACIVGYALSPIDLIPDFVPILGYLDDLILVPIGIALALRLVPPTVMAECRAEAERQMSRDQPQSRAAAVVIVCIWIVAVAIVVGITYHVLRG